MKLKLFDCQFKVKLKTLIFATLITCYGCTNNNLQSVTNDKTKTPSASPTSTPKQVNIFVENSGSMLGYVSQGSNFHLAIDKILTKLQRSEINPSNLHKFYINSRCFEQKDVSTADFIKNMNAKTAKAAKGNLGSTSMISLFDSVFARTPKGTVSVFVSDCIISPGKNQDANNFVGAEQNGISLIADRISKKNYACIAIRATSKFAGFLYDCQDNAKKISVDRPFYIWIIGEKSSIEWFKQNITTTKLDGFTYEFVFVPMAKNSTIPNRILNTNSGNIDNNTIKKAKLKDGKFQFSVGINLSQYSLMGNYLTNKANYSLSNKKYQIVNIKKQSGAGFTHIITISTAKPVSPESLQISLNNKSLPQWVSQYNLDINNCKDFFAPNNMEKTYAIKNVMDGFFEGYYNGKTILATTSVKIN